MIALSEISHGDIVLIEGKELKCVKANFKVREEFKNANGKNNHESNVLRLGDRLRNEAYAKPVLGGEANS